MACPPHCTFHNSLLSGVPTRYWSRNENARSIRLRTMSRSNTLFALFLLSAYFRSTYQYYLVHSYCDSENCAPCTAATVWDDCPTEATDWYDAQCVWGRPGGVRDQHRRRRRPGLREPALLHPHERRQGIDHVQWSDPHLPARQGRVLRGELRGAGRHNVELSRRGHRRSRVRGRLHLLLPPERRRAGIRYA